MVVWNITGPKREKKQEAGENCVKRGSMLSVPYENWVIKSRRVKLPGNVKRVGEKINRSYRIGFSGETYRKATTWKI
jgi:hypothetical protein